jgi:hypothetical protein
VTIGDKFERSDIAFFVDDDLDPDEDDEDFDEDDEDLDDEDGEDGDDDEEETWQVSSGTRFR